MFSRHKSQVILFDDLFIGFPSMLYSVTSTLLIMLLGLGKNIVLNALIVLDDVSLRIALELLQEKYRFDFKDCLFRQEFVKFLV
jgi:hypothetical protein